ncbi:hypothetical protein ACLOJK_018399 [Asimina triloba]
MEAEARDSEEEVEMGATGFCDAQSYGMMAETLSMVQGGFIAGSATSEASIYA